MELCVCLDELVILPYCTWIEDKYMIFINDVRLQTLPSSSWIKTSNDVDDNDVINNDDDEHERQTSSTYYWRHSN
jgi:hypothetical protein